MTEPPWKPAVFLPANLTVSLGEPLPYDGDPLPWCARLERALEVGVGVQVTESLKASAYRAASLRLRNGEEERSVRGNRSS